MKKKPKQTICFVCGKPVVSKPGGVDHDKITAMLGAGVKTAHLACRPREAAMVAQGLHRKR